MYAVIFKAKIKHIDDAYSAMAARMRELALNDYDCLGFHACTEGDDEIAISYWPNKEAILAWKQDPEHQKAQQLGKDSWYHSYQVDIVEVLSQYSHEP